MKTGGEAWRPFTDVAVAQADDGRIVVQSPYVSGDGCFAGQDLIRLDENGGFHLLGRADRIAKIEGKRVSLSEVERALRADVLIAEAAVAILPEANPSLGAVVVLTAEGRQRLAELGRFRLGRLIRQDLGGAIEPAGLPRRWRFVEALPVNAMGKITAEALRAILTTTENERPIEPDIQAVAQGEDWAEVTLFNRPDLLQLDGHFPGMPVVPGVAQIDWVVKFAARYLGLPLEAARKYQVKFHRLTLPDSVATLRLDLDRARGRLDFHYRDAAESLTSGAISLEVP